MNLHEKNGIHSGPHQDETLVQRLRPVWSRTTPEVETRHQPINDWRGLQRWAARTARALFCYAKRELWIIHCTRFTSGQTATFGLLITWRHLRETRPNSKRKERKNTPLLLQRRSRANGEKWGVTWPRVIWALWWPSLPLLCSDCYRGWRGVGGTVLVFIKGKQKVFSVPGRAAKTHTACCCVLPELLQHVGTVCSQPFREEDECVWFRG